MNGNSPEEDKGREISRAALVQAAANKAEALYARLGEITGMSGQEAGGEDTSVIQRRADTLSRFVRKHTHLLGVETGSNGDAPEEEGEAPKRPAADEPKKEVKLSPKSWTVVEEAVASMILHDGKIEKDDENSPIAKLMEENEWTRGDWDLARPALKKLGVLSLNRTGPNYTPYDSITLEMENIAAIEALIAEGKLPDYLSEPLQDIKMRKASEDEEADESDEETGEATTTSRPAEEPSVEELKNIETRAKH